MKKAFKLFLIFLKIGVSIHGGGYVMIGVMERELVEKRKMIDEDSYMEIIAVCQSLPGPIAVTSATFVGYRLNKLVGAIVCLAGIIIPAFITVILVASVLLNFHNVVYVKHALLGIRAAVPILVLSAVLKFWKKLDKTIHNIAFGLIALIALDYFGLNAAILIVFSAIYGIVAYRTFLKKKEGK
ncbi:chromate transporter [uncultured Clostridium sp.]|jgi:chromate transporter|uniref:chromate transporter n=1 Tax=uncultured Clostridium sp. TaxID=59620 RepID=UPI002605C070|nr:chromate transporter [uncultured Clostridium sp.]